MAPRTSFDHQPRERAMVITTGDAADSGLWGGLGATMVEWFFALSSSLSSGSSDNVSSPLNFIEDARTKFEELDEPSANDKVTTSIQDLPTELLAIILYYATRVPASPTSLMRLQQLSTVSSRWRGVVKGTPRLWSRVNTADSLRLIERAMHESKDAPLEIAIDGPFWNRQKFQELERRICVLCAHMKRWRHANIYVYRAPKELFRALAAPVAPRLETMKLTVVYRPTPSVAIFQGATLPMLQELEMDGLPLEREIGEFRNLRVLKMDTRNASEPSPPEINTLLRSLQKLETFDFTGGLRSASDYDNPASYQTIILPHLKSLSVNTRQSKGALDISSYLRSPVCRSIGLTGDLFQSDFPQDLQTALNKAVGHLIPTICSNWVSGERVEIVADAAFSQAYAPDFMLSLISTNARPHMRNAEITLWIIDNVPNKDAEIRLDVRLTSSLAEQLVSLVSLGPPSYLTTLNLSKVDDGGSSVIEYLSKPVSLLGEPCQWPLPHLSSLTVSCYQGCLASLLYMLKARAAGAGDTDSTHPVSLITLKIQRYGRKRAGGGVLALELERLMRGTGGALSCSQGW
ncbi:hypothetical protein FRC01_014086 [Tulasnella sp. 417]|nr:hypothetical protein FRC01_014086 [Tulasnella sp. 417]